MGCTFILVQLLLQAPVHGARDDSELCTASFIQMGLERSKFSKGCSTLTEEDVERPILEVLAEHPGEDGWCLYGDLVGGTDCAAAHKANDLSSYRQLLGSPLDSKCLNSWVPKTIVMPGVEVAPGITNVTLDGSLGSNALEAMDCFVNGFWKAPSDVMIKNFSTVATFSSLYCAYMSTVVPNYQKITMRDFLMEQTADSRALCDLLHPDQENGARVVHAPPSLKAGLMLRGAVRCLLSSNSVSDNGSVICDMAGCARQFCMGPQMHYQDASLC
ncbi:unnamed protein product [Durusdinium trenchii]|uniref:Uncharacterized protein n=2 Tax=Durusdinium trenchii TaxID=1381693 RepID=A0ABP0LFM9_9DINO